MVLSSKRTVVSSASTSASATEALKILHDPKALIGLNPLVVSAVEGPQPVTDQHASSPPSQRYVITDKLPVVGSWCFHRSFSADFTRVKHGMDSRVDAGLGVRLYNQWRVREAEGGAVIEETIQLEAFSFFVPFIVSTLHSSRKDILQKLVGIIEGCNPTST